jgi:hypothetical protein
MNAGETISELARRLARLEGERNPDLMAAPTRRNFEASLGEQQLRGLLTVRRVPRRALLDRRGGAGGRR